MVSEIPRVSVFGYCWYSVTFPYLNIYIYIYIYINIYIYIYIYIYIFANNNIEVLPMEVDVLTSGFDVGDREF